MKKFTFFMVFIFSFVGSALPVEISISTGDKYNTFIRKNFSEKKPVEIFIKLKNSEEEKKEAVYFIEVRDYHGKEVFIGKRRKIELFPGSLKEVKEKFIPDKYGFFEVFVILELKNKKLKKSLPFIVIPPYHHGLRPDSFFASNTNCWRDFSKAEFHQKIGLKVYRQHFADMWSCLSKKSKNFRKPEDPIEFDFSLLDRYVENCKKHDISILGIVGYANPVWARSEEAQKLRMYGPPRSIEEFIRATIPVVKRYKEIKYWEFWNEPWIYGWTWASSSSEYRRFQREWIKAAKKARNDIKVIVGNSASFLVDNISPDPSCFKGIVDADSNHPYKEGGYPTLRGGRDLGYIDYGIQEAKRMRINLHFITENGTEYGGGNRDNLFNASKIVIMHVEAALAGIYQMNIQEGLGWGLNQMRGTAAYAVMTHFLEDRVPVADIWPENPLIWGAIFSNPDFADLSLPRAKEFSSRWKVPGRKGDKTKVAVVWSYTGRDEKNLDEKATLTIYHPEDLNAFDLFGNPVGEKKNGKLTIPFGKFPVYLISENLSVKKMYSLIKNGRIENATPVNMYIFSFTKPVEENPPVVLRIQNQLNRKISVKLKLKLPDGWILQDKVKEIVLKPAELKEVKFEIRKGIPNELNLYPITVYAETDAGKTERQQIVQVACADRRKVEIDGNLNDWEGAIPVFVDSDWLETTENISYYLLNPNIPRPEKLKGKPRIKGKCYTGWDKDNFYIAFAIEEPGLKQDAGKPFKGTKYITGEIDGLCFPFYSGDAIEFAFGFGERANDDYRKPEDPWYWKGAFRDTDYQYIVFNSVNGPKLLRLHKPGIPYRVGFQTEKPPGQGEVKNGKVVIKRKGNITIYEISIPRKEIRHLNPEEQKEMRFGFVIVNDEKVGRRGRIQWSEVAGVFDYWYNCASFQPTWETFLPLQTVWGLYP